MSTLSKYSLSKRVINSFMASSSFSFLINSFQSVSIQLIISWLVWHGPWVKNAISIHKLNILNNNKTYKTQTFSNSFRSKF